jgi:protein-arginine kinase activator protein McsA
LSWQDGATTTESVTDDLLMLQTEAEDKARNVRYCTHCREGWKDVDKTHVTRCPCYKSWRRAVLDLRVAVGRAKEKQDDWFTSEMFNLNSRGE